MLGRTLITAGLVAAAALVVSTPAQAADDPSAGTAGNPWSDQRVMNMAHSGGEMEAPTNTMYAFKRAAALGSDMLELDVQSTKDDELMVIHNSTVDSTTNGTGKIVDKTAAQVKSLDAAYNFAPGTGTAPGMPADSYPLRGMRTGEQPPLQGYTAEDFAIPTLEEVFSRFPDIPINIEIKGTSDLDIASFLHNARLLADFLNESGRTDVIVTSFNDLAVSTFHTLSPEVPLAPGMAGLSAYFLTGIKPIHGTVALQIPVTLNGAIPIATPEFIARAHADGYAVHVWFSGTAVEDEATYNALVDACADGLMPARPQFFEQILRDRDIVRPGEPGVDPCG